MAAPRKFTDAHRAAIWSLHEQGVSKTEIARRCENGLASVGPFKISRTGARDIISAIARERRAQLPQSLEDIEGTEAAAKYPERVLRIVNAETDRIEGKTKKGAPLRAEDLDQLRRMGKMVRELRSFPAAQSPTRSSSPADGDALPDALERVAQQMQRDALEAKATPGEAETSPTDRAREGRAEVQSSPTRTPARQATNARPPDR